MFGHVRMYLLSVQQGNRENQNVGLQIVKLQSRYEIVLTSVHMCGDSRHLIEVQLV